MTSGATVQLDEGVHLSLWRMIFRRSIWECTRWTVLGILAVVAIIILNSGTWIEVASALLVGFLLLSVLMGFQWLRIPAKSRQFFRDTPTLSEPQEYLLDDDGFTVSQQSGHFRTRWEHVVKWEENTEIFAIFPSRITAYTLPKAQVAQGTINFARKKLIESGLPKRGGVRK